MVWQPFNINELVRVKLTDAGVAELKRQSDELRVAFPNLSEPRDPIGADGWYTAQLWVVMNAFGPMITLGAVSPFSPVIEFRFPAPPAVAKEGT
jgi:hypothetical protein